MAVQASDVHGRGFDTHQLHEEGRRRRDGHCIHGRVERQRVQWVHMEDEWNKIRVIVVYEEQDQATTDALVAGDSVGCRAVHVDASARARGTGRGPGLGRGARTGRTRGQAAAGIQRRTHQEIQTRAHTGDGCVDRSE